MALSMTIRTRVVNIRLDELGRVLGGLGRAVTPLRFTTLIRTITTTKIMVVQAIHITMAQVRILVIQVIAPLEAQEEKERLTTHVTVNLI